MSRKTLYTRRMVWIAVASTAISMLVMFVVMANGVINQSSAIVAEMAARGLRSPAGLGCTQAPQLWGSTASNGSQMYAYDIKTLRSMNPEAPVIPHHLAEQIRQRGVWRTRTHFPLLHGAGAILLKVSEHGPCSLLMVHWRVAPQTRFARMLWLFLVFLVGIGLCVMLAYSGFVKPVLERIEAVAQTARNIGQQEHLFVAREGQQDDLTTIEQGMALANQRILEDKQRLAEKNQTLAQHIADIAHDLRTPIASLQLVLERLVRSHQDHSHQELAVALADTVYLENLTNNLSLATRLREGLVDQHTQPTTNLCHVVERVAGRFGLLAREKGLFLDFAHPDQPIWVNGSDTLYERILSNLVHNAVRYGESSGHIVMLLETSATQFTLEVMDDGPGVPPTEIPKLKDRMYRSTEARQRDSTGEGLGLAITHELCHILDLTLSFSTIHPRGLRVSLQGNYASSQGNLS